MKTLMLTLIASLSLTSFAHAQWSDAEIEQMQMVAESETLLDYNPALLWGPGRGGHDRGRDRDHDRGRPGRGGPGRGGPGYPPGRGTNSQTVRCESESYRYSECYVRANRIYSVRVARQLSSSPCIPGRSFGNYSDRIWVDNGCRAIFEVITD